MDNTDIFNMLACVTCKGLQIGKLDLVSVTH